MPPVFAIFFSCQKEDTENLSNATDDIIPNAFKVDIPDAISSKNATKNVGLKSIQANDDTLNGNEIYEMLRHFIAIGEFSAELNEILLTYVDFLINAYKIEPPTTIPYESEDDKRTKELKILTDKVYNNVSYEYFIQITDVEANANEANNDGVGMQIYWSLNPVKGVSILRPYNVDRTDTASNPLDVFYTISYYGESPEPGYDEHMTVEIVGMPLTYPGADQYAIDNLKLFVGKKGNIIDVKGNSNHPNAYFFNPNIDNGFNWAFVASGDENLDIGVAEVGLPSNSLNSSDRNILLDTNSLYNVWFDLVTDYLDYKYGSNLEPTLRDSLTDAYLKNTKSPGFFDENGFVSAKVPPANITDGRYDKLTPRLDDLKPFNPSEINSLSIQFENQ